MDNTFIELTMPLGEARQFRWPFTGEPMGEAFHNKRINAGQMLWAARDSDNPRLKAAARTLLAHEIEVPTKMATAEHNRPEIIKGSDYLERMERWSHGETFFLLGFGVGLLFAYLVLLFRESFAGTLTIPVLVLAVILVSYGVFTLRKYMSQSYTEYKNYRQGREGEDAVAAQIADGLDNRWTIFRNFVLPGRKDDIDIVLIGPGGVWAVEVKTYGLGTSANPSVQLPSKAKGVESGISPDAQAKKNAMKLRAMLQGKGVNIPYVHAAVAFPGFKPTDLQSNDVTIWHSVDMADKITQLNLEHVLDVSISKAATEVLTALNSKR
jgi:hypothetical protein